MAVIFFDGFSRAVNTNHWTLTGASFTSGVARINESASATNKIKLSNFGTHTDKKIYFGFRLNAAAAPDAATQSFLKFYDDTDALVLEIKWNLNVTSPDVGLQVVQDSTPVTTYTVLDSMASTGRGASGASHVIFTNTRLLEFEIDIENDTIAARYEGQEILNSDDDAVTALSDPLGNIAAIEIYGPSDFIYSSACDILDMYLIDDTGTFANTWLGTSYAVHSPNFENDDPVANEWSVTASQNRGSAVFNDDDGDTSYTNTNAYDKFQIYRLINISASGLSPVVGAIRCDSISRAPTLTSAYKYACQIDSTNYAMGDAITLSSTVYAQQPARFIHTNPATEAQWAVSEVNAAHFGAMSTDPDPPE